MFSFLLPVDMIECGQSFPHTVNLPGYERSFSFTILRPKPIVLETFFSIPKILQSKTFYLFPKSCCYYSMQLTIISADDGWELWCNMYNWYWKKKEGHNGPPSFIPLLTVFENNPKCLIPTFQFWHFPPILSFKIGKNVWPQASCFQKWDFSVIFKHRALLLIT